LVGSGIARRAELVDGCPAAATGETTPASRRLEQANKRAQELQGVLKEWGAARVGEEKQAGVEFTVWHPWRTATARCSRGEKTGRLYSRAQGGEGGFLAYQGNQVMAWAAAWSEYGGMGGDARRPIANQGRRGARTAATPLGGWRGGREHVAHKERVGKAVRRGRPHGARTGG
jgi:hypothetical protein